MQPYTQNWGYTYFPSVTSSDTLECDMASTTEAIYETAKMNGLYWALLFLVIFGIAGFMFTRGYIRKVQIR